MRPSRKELLARVLAGARIPAARLRLTRNPERLTVLAYHRVFDIGNESDFPYDPELVSATPDDFAWQMEFVGRHFEAITFERLIAATDGGPGLPRRSLIITFDDGHLDNYVSAFPILKRLGLPATIFLSTGYIGTRGTFWFDRVANLLYRAPQGSLAIDTVRFSADLRDVPSRREAAERLLGILKRSRDDARLAALRQLEQLANSARIGDEVGSGAMNWEQVREMSQSGIEFGSHSVTHPILSALGDDALEWELTESRREIEERTGKACNVLAYPVGSGAFDARITLATQRCGYKLGVSYASGINALLRLDRFAIRRLHVERYTSRAYFQSVLAMPGVFG